MSEELRGRIRGCLLGGATGDALGAPVESASLAQIRARFGPDGVRRFEPAYGRAGSITDDTQMTLFTAEGLILAAQGGVFPELSGTVRIVHRAYLRWLRTQGSRSSHPTFARTSEGWLAGVEALGDRRSPDETCLAALRNARMGRVEQPLNTSKGCGAVVRIAPVGLALAAGDPFRLGCELAALTHGHPTAYLAAGFLALVVRDLVSGGSLELSVGEALEELVRWPGHEECRAAVEGALERSRTGSPTPETVESLGAGRAAEEALGIALYSAFVAPDLVGGLRVGVNHGGASDSTGAISGSLLGAILGPSALPDEWLAALELRAEIERIADELYDACARPSSGSS